MNQHFHPEFGYFHPLPRFRRDLRMAIAAFASGATLGAVAILAVHVSYSEPENASAPGAVSNLASNGETPAPLAPESATPEQRNEQPYARSSTVETGAVIAKLPLARPDSVGLIPTRADRSGVWQSVEPIIPQLGVQAAPDLRTGEAAHKGSAHPRAQQKKSSRNLIVERELVHREHRKRATGTAAAPALPEETAPQASTAVYARGRTMFWEWPR
jgi:hypothetical protein